MPGSYYWPLFDLSSSERDYWEQIVASEFPVWPAHQVSVLAKRAGSDDILVRVEQRGLTIVHPSFSDRPRSHHHLYCADWAEVRARWVEFFGVSVEIDEEDGTSD